MLRCWQTLRMGWVLSLSVCVFGIVVLYDRLPDWDGGADALGWKPPTSQLVGRWNPRPQPQIVPVSFGEPSSKAPEAKKIPMTRRPNRKLGSDISAAKLLEAEKSLAKANSARNPANFFEHIVQRKESYWSLAGRFLGDPRRYRELSAFNANAKLRPNMKIKIPGEHPATKVRKSYSAATGKLRSKSQQDRIHVVRRGEVLSKIAKRYYKDSRWRRILRANPKIKRARSLRVGAHLRIPFVKGKMRS